MRVFVGINISEDIKKKIIDLQKKIYAISSKIRFTKSENIHLTFKFLGSLSEEECKEFIQGIETGLAGRDKFSLQIKNFGVFPNVSNPRILWIGVEKNNNLLEIQKDIEILSNKFNVPPEKGFKGHITIARNNNKIDISSLKQLKEKFNDFIWGNLVVKEIDIIESQLKPTGAQYSVLKSIKLKG